MLGIMISPIMQPQNMVVIFFSFSGAMMVFAIAFHFSFRHYHLEKAIDTGGARE